VTMNAKPRTIEIDSETEARLRALAQRRGQTPADVIADAVELLDIGDEDLDVEEDLRRLREFERSGLGVPFEDVEAWIRSWGTPNELPPPKPRKAE
jgi:predicted transcriptional regulator